MSKKTSTLHAAEELVRKVLSEDLNQKKVADAVVRDVALKVSKTVPITAPKQRKAA